MPSDVPFGHVVGSLEELDALYGAPMPMVADKKIDHVDEGAAAVIAASPLVVLATADASGRCTVSPRGGPPGFVRVLDPHRLLLVDEPGNRLLDGARNLLVNPRVGLLFVLPGRSWTLRVSGRAWLTRDPALLEPRPGAPVRRMAVGIAVEQVFVHCGRAFDLGHVWDASTWGADGVPDVAEVFRAHVATGPTAR